MAGGKLRLRVDQIIEKFSVTDKFSKGELIGVIDGEYPETFLFEFPNDKADLLDDILEGAYVTVFYNYRTNRVASTIEGARDVVYLSLSAWKIEM